MQKTTMIKKADVQREWHKVDAAGAVVGRVATEIATKLIGKHKPSYTPHIDGGDYVVVINAEQVEFTGAKEQKKQYYTHSGYIGGLKQRSAEKMRALKPTEILRQAVFNMLPKNKLRTERMNRLKLYAGSEHKHESQLSQ